MVWLLPVVVFSTTVVFMVSSKDLVLWHLHGRSSGLGSCPRSRGTGAAGRWFDYGQSSGFAEIEVKCCVVKQTWYELIIFEECRDDVSLADLIGSLRFWPLEVVSWSILTRWMRQQLWPMRLMPVVFHMSMVRGRPCWETRWRVPGKVWGEVCLICQVFLGKRQAWFQPG